MEILLVIEDKKGRNILFVMDNFQTLTIKGVIDFIKNGIVSGLHLVSTKSGVYIRSNLNSKKDDNLDSISISFSSLKNGRKSKSLSKYNKKRNVFLKEQEKQKEKVVYIDREPKKTEKEIIKYLAKYKKHILSAAKDLKVDTYLLGAILIDEDLRREWQDDWFDRLGQLGIDFSVGIAQIKVSTAKDLIKRGFYNPNPKDDKLSALPTRELYKYLNDPKYSIYFAAAKIRQIKNDFSLRYNLNRLEVVADLYSRKNLDKTKGKVSSRGKQIAKEFYKIAKKALK
ncbi:hypothetical protein A2282_08955 [candidate division WOR-1 bacterium RIFOXYA12_FULL_36_13]|nr:MAG: hypothetical protein A2282_08955 [candidate division WOR-1 bacterium RIFOXYA12_FULL_36_13]